MHEKILPVKGRLCRSTAGRDAGDYFIVTEILDDDYVLIADGRIRRLGHPKKKKLKHLHLTPLILEEAAARLDKPGRLADGELRKMIEQTEKR